MSTALGIAAVTHVLKDLLNDGFVDNDVAFATGTAIRVTSLPPGQVEAANGTPASQLNMFMYRVTPNVGWSNIGYPSRNSNGDYVNNPPLALDLHYLLTAFGESELHAEILLGYGMQLLHENPVLIRSAITRSLTPTTPPADPNLVNTVGSLSNDLLALAGSNLAEQIEQIKITNENINTEEMSRLWTAFQTRYRPCTAYKATVVLIESNRSTNSPLPVRQRKFYTIPFKQPNIEKILSQELPTGPILSNRKIVVGNRLVIRGTQLKRDPIAILINGEAFTPAATAVSDTEVSLTLPNTLKSGMLGVQIAHYIEMGTPATDRRGAESNLEAFVLSPTLSGQSLDDISSSENSDEETVISGSLSVNVNPVVYKEQRIMLLMNELSPPAGAEPKSYSFLLPTIFWEDKESPLTTVSFPISNVRSGDYLLRIQVDGAESPLLSLPLTNPPGPFTDPHLLIQE